VRDSRYGASWSLDERGVEHVAIEFLFSPPCAADERPCSFFQITNYFREQSSPGGCDLEKLIEVFSNNGSVECLGTFGIKLGPDGLPS
jgi:hypothetical protein